MFNLLVVDDDKSTRRFMRALLEAENYTVELAENGVQALDILEHTHVDLVILDIMMPEMDGYEFTTTIREVDEKIPILMVSAKQLPEDKRKGFMVGTDDFMVKPVDEEEFLLRIKALLRRARIAAERKLVIGDVTLDFDTRSITRNGVTEVLPQKEFLLLFKLLSEPGRTFTRIELMDEIWGADSSTGWETVTVHIAHLRRRFEGWNEFSIQSMRGLGYRAVKNV